VDLTFYYPSKEKESWREMACQEDARNKEEVQNSSSNILVLKGTKEAC
jgi:hypothetical protein